MSVYDPRAGLYVGGEDFGVPPRAEIETLVRFEHPAKLLSVAELPGAAGMSDAALAEAYGVPVDVLRELREGFRQRVRAAACELLRDETLVEAVRGLPDGTVVALGDSTTDDYLSWAQILRECVDLVCGAHTTTVVNAGVSGDTTADALRRLYGIVELKPDLVIVMLGTNDCQRHGPRLERLVSPAETARNLAAIADWLPARAWITPPPVREDALAAAVGPRPFTLRDEDVRGVGALLGGLGGPVVDVYEPLRELLMDDGVHPSFDGQRAIAAAVLRVVGGGVRAPSQNESGTGKP